MRRTVVIIVLLMWSLAGWGEDAKGYALRIHHCPMTPPDLDLKIHLTHFPRQKSDQELVLSTYYLAGPAGLTDWVDEVPGELCTKSEKMSCVKLSKARVQVLHYSCCGMLFGRLFPNYTWRWARPRISGNFEATLPDGTEIHGSFKAKEKNEHYANKLICE